jgi:bromodomain-containing factor 1
MNDALTNGHSPLPTILPNGTLNPNGIQIDSPTTPVSNNLTASDIKIEMDIQEPESDVRHEPVPNKIDTLENASIAPQVGTPLHPCPSLLLSYPCRYSLSFFLPLASIAIDPPHGTPPPPPGELLEDVKMAEGSHPEKLDVQMAEVGPNGRLSEQPKRSREPTPVASFPGATSSSTAVDSVGASTSYTTPNEYSAQEDEGSLPPPAKRARTFSDPDQASVIMHVSVSYLCAPLLAC